MGVLWRWQPQSLLAPIVALPPKALAVVVAVWVAAAAWPVVTVLVVAVVAMVVVVVVVVVPVVEGWVEVWEEEEVVVEWGEVGARKIRTPPSKTSVPRSMTRRWWDRIRRLRPI
jgi:membrane protein YdbS with pleckstrin-like domain